MKRIATILLGLTCCFSFAQLNAQCTPDPSCTDTGNPGQMCPDTLSDGYLNVAYTQVVTILPPASFEIGGNTLNLSHIKLISIGNMPPGLTYETNTSDNLFAVGSSYCAVLSGIPTTVGDYQLEVNIKPYISATDPLPFVVTDDTSLMITIHAENAVWDLIEKPFTYEIYPNPFTDQFILEVNADSPSSGTLKLLDAMGRVVKNEDLELSTGNNQFIIETGKLERGIYFYHYTDGVHFFSEKILKQ